MYMALSCPVGSCPPVTFLEDVSQNCFALQVFNMQFGRKSRTRCALRDSGRTKCCVFQYKGWLRTWQVKLCGTTVAEQPGNAPMSVVVSRISSCYRAGLFALCGQKGGGESAMHRLWSWTSVRCCEPPMKSKRRSERNSCQCHCMHSARASTPLCAACMTPSLWAGKKKGPESAGHV